MKSQLLKQALMAKYQTGGKVKPPVKKEEKVIGKGNWTEAHAVKKLEEGYVPNLDADGKPILKDGKPTYKKPAVKNPDIEITPRKPSTTPKRASGNKYVPSKPKVKITPGETQEDIVFLDEPVVPKPPTPDPWKQAFAYQGRIQQDFGTQYPDVVIDGKRVKIQNRTIPAKLSKDGTWDTHGGYANATQVFGYVDPKDPSKIVPIDMNMSKAPLQDKDGKAYYTPDLLTPYVAPSIDKVVAGGALRAVGATRDKGQHIQEGIDEAKRLGVAAPTVTNYVESINSGLGSLGTGKDIKVKESTNPLQYKGVDPTVNPLPIPANMEELKVKFKKGGLVKKYYTGGPITNPKVTYNDSGIYNQQSNKGLSKLMQQQSKQPNGGGLKLDDGMDVAIAGLDGASKVSKFSELSGQEKQGLGQALDMAGQATGAGVDYLDRKDGNSTIAGQAGAGALKGAGKGAAIGLNPAVLALTGGNSAWIAPLAGAAIGGTMGGIRGKKEKTERIGLAADEMRGSVNQQQYSDSKDTYKSDLYREEDQKKGLRGLFAKGGTIKGEGTGTSDSIKTKMGKDGIQENSFVVPAKNNGLAKIIRKDLLGDNPDKVAKFKKGGNADMAVSNGEHLFTPAEKKKITAYLGKEILEKLAPEAEDGEDKKCGGKVGKYGNGGDVKGNTTKRMTSSGNPALDAEIDLLYKTGNWRKEAVDKIEAKAKALGLDTGEGIFDKRARTGVFKDLQVKSDYFSNEVNKELQNKKQQKEVEFRRSNVVPSAPKGLSEQDLQTYNKLKNDVVVAGKDLAPLQKFVAAKKDSLEESNQFQGQLKRGIETGKEYAKKYQLAQDLKAKLEYAKKNADKFTAEELQSAVEQEKKANLEYNKLKTPSQYANPNNKRMDAIYEEFAKKRYKPTKVEERQSAPVMQQKITPVVKEQVKVVAPAVKSNVVSPVKKAAPASKQAAVIYTDEVF